MPWEQLLILFFLVVVPLVQGLLRRRKLEEQRTAQRDDAFDSNRREPDWEVNAPTLEPNAYLPQDPPRPVVVRPAPVFDHPAVNRALPDLASRSGTRLRSTVARASAPTGAPAVAGSPTSIKATLRHPEGLRRAVLMSVILGKPRSLDTERFE